MTSAGELRRVARVAKHNDGLEALARVGFVGFGVTHLVLAWIAVQIAFGRPPAEGDQVGAFQVLHQGAFGTLLLVVVAAGLAGASVWQALEAAVGHLNAHGAARVGERLASAGRAGAYGFFAFSAAKLVFSPTAGGGAHEKEEAAGSLLSMPAGQWLVGAIGVGVIAVGLGLAWYGLTRHFERHLRTGPASPTTRRTVTALGVVGYVAKAVAYTIAGVLVVVAAVRYDPSASRGLDAALRALPQQPGGTWLLLAVAVGIGAYGLFAVAQSRYRKV
jgi:hypothetical protein